MLQSKIPNPPRLSPSKSKPKISYPIPVQPPTRPIRARAWAIPRPEGCTVHMAKAKKRKPLPVKTPRDPERMRRIRVGLAHFTATILLNCAPPASASFTIASTSIAPSPPSKIRHRSC